MKLAKCASAKMELLRKMMGAALYVHPEWSFSTKDANVLSIIMKITMEYAGDVGEKPMGQNAREILLESPFKYLFHNSCYIINISYKSIVCSQINKILFLFL